MKRQNITLEPSVYEKFSEIASKRGIKLSPWINSKMKEFIEEEEKRVGSKEENIDEIL